MRRSVAHQIRSPRRGISLVETIVIVAVLLVLSSVALTYIQTARVHSRLQICVNNQRQLALATVNYAATFGGTLPLYSDAAPGMASDQRVLWVVPILPYLDLGSSVDYIAQQKSQSEAIQALELVLMQPYDTLQCPDDSTHFREQGGLSYGGNIGYGAWEGTPERIKTAYDFKATDHSAGLIDWNNNGELDPEDKKVARATGVFWQADPDGFRMTLDAITDGDGAGQTMLFAENVTLPLLHRSRALKNGHNPSALAAGIGVGYTALGLKKQEGPDLSLNRVAQPTAEYVRYFAPISNCRADQARSPRASSMHSGVVNVVFVDGHVAGISRKIDWVVWASLLSSNGVKFRQKTISDNTY